MGKQNVFRCQTIAMLASCDSINEQFSIPAEPLMNFIWIFFQLSLLLFVLMADSAIENRLDP